MEQFYQWNENDITIGEPHTSYLENSWDKSNSEFLKTISIRNLHMVWKYLHHLVRESKESSTPWGSILFLCSQTNSVTSLGGSSCHGDWKTPIRAQTPYLAMDTKEVPSKNPGKTPTRMLTNLLPSRKVSREKSQYTILKDEKYFEAFERNLLVTATTHDCEEILNRDHKPENNADCRELLKQKQYFMYSAFNKVLQSDMGKTIVRKYASSLDAQSVWRDFESHTSTSSKGLNERHRLHAYVSTTVYDRSWKGTTEQFVLHFHEQFRQLDEITPQNEHLPHSGRLTLLQTAARSVPELRIVETMEEYVLDKFIIRASLSHMITIS